METESRAQAPGLALVQLLARLRGADAPPSPSSQSLSDRLSQWIDWPQAVALSSALDARLASSPGCDGAVADDDCAHLRASLTGTIERDRAFSADVAPSDSAFYRQRYLTLQQVMGAEIALVRRRLRHRLTQRTAALGRLAAMDAAMEKALGERERALLAPLPDLLATHFERLRLAAHDGPESRSWLDVFRRDMKRLLFAELDVRLQPTRGLLAALRTTAGPHAQSPA